MANRTLGSKWTGETHFQLQAEDEAMQKEEKPGEDVEIDPKPKTEKKVVIQPQPKEQDKEEEKKPKLDPEPDEVWEEAEETQEAKKAKGLPLPKEPTSQERAMHELTHMPYRSWCSLCVKSKAKADKAKPLTEKESTLQMDYCFMNTAGNEEDKVTMLTCVDTQTGLGMAVVVEAKGYSPYALQELKKFIQEIGRTNYTLQTDQEPAIKQLAQRVVREMGGVSLRHSPTYHPQSKGSIEKYHQTLLNQF